MKNYIKSSNKVNGLTLIELIISIALIGIIAIGFLPGFTVGNKWVNEAGNRTKALKATQQVIDNIYIKSENTTDTVTQIVNSMTSPYITSKPVDPKTIDLGSGRYASGSEVKITCNVNGKQITVTTFVPKNP